MNRKKIILILVLLFSIFNLFSQSFVSNKQLLQGETSEWKNDTIKIEIFNTYIKIDNEIIQIDDWKTIGNFKKSFTVEDNIEIKYYFTQNCLCIYFDKIQYWFYDY